MKHILLISLLFSLTACASDPFRNTTDDAYNENLTEISQQFEAAQIDSGAPLIAAEFADIHSWHSFSSHLCATIDHNACQALYLQTFYNRLKEKYTYMSPISFDRWCGAHPIECRDYVHAEEMARMLYGIGLGDAKHDKLAEAQSQHEQAQLEHQKKVKRAFQAFGQGFKNAQSVDCRTTRALGGYNTTCSR